MNSNSLRAIRILEKSFTPLILRARFLLLVTLATHSLLAQEIPPQAAGRPHTLRIAVIDSATGAAIDQAQIRFLHAGISRLTDQNGKLVVALAAPSLDTIEVKRLGYAPLAAILVLRPGESTEMDFEMQAVVFSLDTLRVRATASAALERAGFYDRRAMYRGVFLGPEELARIKPTRPSDIFRNTPGTKLVRTKTGGYNVRFIRAQNCAPLVFVDKVLVTTEIGGNLSVFGYGRGSRQSGSGIDELSAQGLAGVEVYQSTAQIPAEYNMTGSACGVILFWTGI